MESARSGFIGRWKVRAGKFMRLFSHKTNRCVSLAAPKEHRQLNFFGSGGLFGNGRKVLSRISIGMITTTPDLFHALATTPVLTGTNLQAQK